MWHVTELSFNFYEYSLLIGQWWARCPWLLLPCLQSNLPTNKSSFWQPWQFWELVLQLFWMLLLSKPLLELLLETLLARNLSASRTASCYLNASWIPMNSFKTLTWKLKKLISKSIHITIYIPLCPFLLLLHCLPSFWLYI